MKEARKVVLIKAEVTPGVDAAPTALADALATIDFEAVRTEAQTDAVEYSANYYGAGDNFTISAYRSVGFTVPLVGSGTAGTPLPAPMAALFAACGHAATVTAGTSVVMSPVSNGEQSATVHAFIDGYLRKLRMARANLRWVFEEGRIGRVVVDNLMGLTQNAVDLDAGLPTFAELAKPVAFNKENTTITLGGLELKCSRAEINAGRQHAYRNHAGAEDILVEDAISTAQLVFELPRVAERNLEQIRMENTPQALSIVHGKVAGRIVTLEAPKAIITGWAESNVKGRLFVTLDLALRPVAGNDQYQVTLT